MSGLDGWMFGLESEVRRIELGGGGGGLSGLEGGVFGLKILMPPPPHPKNQR